jgi:hypothetical protein
LTLPKVTKGSTHLHNNKIMYYTHPKVISWGQTDRQMDGQIFAQYSGTSSHSLMGVCISLVEQAVDHPVAAIHKCVHNSTDSHPDVDCQVS